MFTPNYIVDPEDTDCMPFTRYLLKTTVEKARERLDSFGYGINNLEKIYNANIYEAVDYSAFLSHLRVEYSEQELKAHERIDKNVTFTSVSDDLKMSNKFVSRAELFDALSHSTTQMDISLSKLTEILEFCNEPRTRAELQKFCGYKSPSHFREKILAPLLAGKQLILTIPEKPNSPK